MTSEKPGLWARMNRGLEGLRRGLANVGFVLLVVLVVLGLSQGDGAPPVPEGGALVLTLDGPLVDAPPTPDPLAALFDEGGVEPLVLAEVLRALKAVESDAALKGVVLDLDAFPGAGFATLERLGEALAALRDAGKTVVTHSEGLSQAAYYLASFSDELYLDPEGALWLRGLASEPLYFGAALKESGFSSGGKVSKKGSRKGNLHPYQIFVKEFKPDTSKMKDKSQIGKTRMRLAAEAWKNLTDKEKGHWKDKSVEHNKNVNAKIAEDVEGAEKAKAPAVKAETLMMWDD